MALKFVSVKSSNVAAVAYDARVETLHVRFNDGRVYAYGGIKPETYAELLAADSAGNFVHRSIKPIATSTRRVV